MLPIGNTEISSAYETPSDTYLNNRRRKSSNNTTNIIAPNSDDTSLSIDEVQTDGDLSDSSDDSEVCLIPTREVAKQTSRLDPFAPEFTPALLANTSTSNSSRLSDLNVQSSGDTCMHTTNSEVEASAANESVSQNFRVENELSESSEISRESDRQLNESSRNNIVEEPEQIEVRRSNRVSKPPERFRDYIRY